MSQLYQSARIFTEPQIEVTLNEENVVVNVVEASPEIEVTISQAAYWGAIQGTLSNQTDLQNALDAKVPYTGATGNVNLGEYGITSGYLQLDTTPTTYTAAVGNIGWNDTVGTIETTLKGGNVVFKHGRDMFERIVNKTGGQLSRSNYQAVRISTAQGQRLGVALAQANNDNNSADTIGLVVEDIAVNQEGYIYTVGEVGEINTTGFLQGETWADGDVLYLSPTTAGRITNVKPVAPQHLVVIGYVVYAHANHGKIYVKIMNGWEIGELHDVRITNPLNNQVLKYNDSLNIWENGTASGGVTSITASSPLTGGTITTSGTIGIQQATGSQDGYLSATDWTTFNNKQNALTNPVTGTGTSGQVSYWSGSTTQTGSNNLFWDAANSRLGVGTNAPARTFDVNGLAGFTGTTASDGGQLGSELLGSGGWTLGAGWTGDFATGFAHSSGTATLTNTLAAVNGTYYRIGYTVTNRTTGSFTLAFGGYSASGLTATGTVGPRATSTGTVVITPTTDFNGTIVLSIRIISASSASIQLRNSAGTVTNEIRNDASNSNVIIGTDAGTRNLGTNNTFVGSGSGQNTTIGGNNTFTGRSAGTLNTIGTNNSFFGSGAGQNNTAGTASNFFGSNSGNNNTTGGNNNFFGFNAGFSNSTASNNAFFGSNAAFNNTTGGNNISFGSNAGRYISSGSNLTITSNSVFLGFDTRANADSETNQTVIGYQAIGLGSNTTVIGNSSTTFGRWWGNLLIGTSTNAGFALDVNGTARIQNDLTISDTRNIILATGTGTKIGTATSQKLGFWNATPIVQPTTAVAAATRVGGGGTTVTDTDTFDGYTLAQIVKALRNTGILA